MKAYEITIESGHSAQSNFHEYPPIRMNEFHPDLDASFPRQITRPPDWANPRCPQFYPQPAMQYFAVTGKRVRSLPLAKHGYRCA